MRVCSTLFVLLALWSCGSKPNAHTKQLHSDSVNVIAQNAFDYYVAQQLRDTLSNGARLTFETLSKASYDSLWRGEINFEMPLEDPGSVVETVGDCFLVRYRSGRQDSFCNEGADSDNGYSVKGAWKGLLMIDNAGDEFLVSLSDGARYDLNGTHLLSPDEKRLILYSDANQNTLTNDLFINRIRPAAIENIVHYEFSDATVTDAAWIADNQCLLLLTQLQENENDPIIRAYYLLAIN